MPNVHFSPLTINVTTPNHGAASRQRQYSVLQTCAPSCKISASVPSIKGTSPSETSLLSFGGCPSGNISSSSSAAMGSLPLIPMRAQAPHELVCIPITP